MKFRGVLLLLFLVPLTWGLLTLARGVVIPIAPRCPHIQVDQQGEEHPGPMRPEFTCHLYNTGLGEPTGTRTYEQQKNAQKEERGEYYERGAVYIVYALAGLGAM